eukprot:TRINITY_DN3846_c4_g1_i2.p1 TRINITY_DN3846_c4_g1~~TRINITY_DN3846_c4_g1_i2.p1  ORF type:complete len:2290 (+),score=841.95 TRINITY_DN3846_c4_g1_i2:725-6871(+)
MALKWLPELNKLLSITQNEHDSVVKVFNPASMEEDVSGLVQHRCLIIASEFVPGRDRLFLATEEGDLEHYHYLPDAKMNLDSLPPADCGTDLALAQGMSAAKAKQRREERARHRILYYAKRRLRHVSSMKCEFPSLNLHWDGELGHNGLLFSGARSGDIFGYDVTETYINPTPAPTVHCHIQAHDEPISCLTTLPGMFNGPRKLISASFFGRVTVTDLIKNQSIELRGNYRSQRHSQGVYSVDYNTYYNLLITSGFEPDPILWLPTQSHNQFIAKLQDTEEPHKHSLLGAKMVPGTDNIVSCDTSGMFKLWDIRKIQCVSTWHLDRTVANVAPDMEALNFVVDPDPQRRVLYVTARNGMNGVDMHTLHPTLLPTVNNRNAHDTKVVDVRYNATTKTFISVSAKEVKIWKADTGVPVFSACDVVEGDISCLTLDEAGRRFILGSNKGGVTVHSYATGAVAQTLKGTGKEVCVVLYMTHSKMICAGSLSGQIQFYHDAETSVSYPHQSFRLPVGVTSMAYSAPLHLVAVGDASEDVSVYDAHSGLGSYRLLCKMCDKIKKVAPKKAQGAAAAAAAQRQSTSSFGEPDDAGAPRPDAPPDADNDAQALEDRSRLEGYMFPAYSEITSTVFLTPYPALAVATATGGLQLYTVRPYPHPYQLVTMWKSPRPKVSHLVATVTTFMKFVVRRSEQLLVTGDDQGYIVIYDLREVSITAGLQPTQFPQKEMYVTDRRLVDARKPRLHSQWRVAKDPVTSFDLVPDVNVLAIAAGDNVILYSLDGTPLGQLCQGRAKGLVPQDDPLPEYKFTFDKRKIDALRIFSAVHHRAAQQQQPAAAGKKDGAAGRPPQSPTGGAQAPGSPRDGESDAASSPRSPARSPSPSPKVRAPAAEAGATSPVSALRSPLQLPSDVASEARSERSGAESPKAGPGSPRGGFGSRKKRKKDGQPWGFLKSTIDSLALKKKIETGGLENIVAGISLASISASGKHGKQPGQQAVTGTPPGSPRLCPPPCNTPDPPPTAMPKHAANMAIGRAGRVSPTKRSARHTRMERDAAAKVRAYRALMEAVDARGDCTAAAAARLQEELGGEAQGDPNLRHFLQIAKGIRWVGGAALFTVPPKRDYAEPLQSHVYRRLRRPKEFRPAAAWMAREIQAFQEEQRERAAAAAAVGEPDPAAYGVLMPTPEEPPLPPPGSPGSRSGAGTPGQPPLSPAQSPQKSAAGGAAAVTPQMLLKAAKEFVRKAKVAKEEGAALSAHEAERRRDVPHFALEDAPAARHERAASAALDGFPPLPEELQWASGWVDEEDLREGAFSAAGSPGAPGVPASLRGCLMTPDVHHRSASTLLASPPSFCLPRTIQQRPSSVDTHRRAAFNTFATAAPQRPAPPPNHFAQLLHTHPSGGAALTGGRAPFDAFAPAALQYPLAESPYLRPGRAPPATPNLMQMTQQAAPATPAPDDPGAVAANLLTRYDEAGTRRNDASVQGTPEQPPAEPTPDGDAAVVAAPPHSALQPPDTPLSWVSAAGGLPLHLRGVARAIAKRAAFAAAVATALATLHARHVVASVEGHLFCECVEGFFLYGVTGAQGEASRFIGHLASLTVDQETKTLSAEFRGRGAKGVKPPPWPIKLRGLHPPMRRALRQICRAAGKWGVDAADVRELLQRCDAEQETMSCVDQRHVVDPAAAAAATFPPAAAALAHTTPDPSACGSPRALAPVRSADTLKSTAAAAAATPEPKGSPVDGVSCFGTAMMTPVDGSPLRTPVPMPLDSASGAPPPAAPLAGVRAPGGLRKGTTKEAYRVAATAAAEGGLVMCGKPSAPKPLPRASLDSLDAGGAPGPRPGSASSTRSTQLPRTPSVDIVKRPRAANIEAPPLDPQHRHTVGDVVAASVHAANRVAQQGIYCETAWRKHVETAARSRGLGMALRRASSVGGAHGGGFQPSIESYNLTYEERDGQRSLGTATRSGGAAAAAAARPNTTGGTRRKGAHRPRAKVAKGSALAQSPRAVRAARAKKERGKEEYLVRGVQKANPRLPSGTPPAHPPSLHSELLDAAEDFIEKGD